MRGATHRPACMCVNVRVFMYYAVHVCECECACINVCVQCMCVSVHVFMHMCNVVLVLAPRHTRLGTRTTSLSQIYPQIGNTINHAACNP